MGSLPPVKNFRDVRKALSPLSNPQHPLSFTRSGEGGNGRTNRTNLLSIYFYYYFLLFSYRTTDRTPTGPTGPTIVRFLVRFKNAAKLRLVRLVRLFPPLPFSSSGIVRLFGRRDVSVLILFCGSYQP